NTFIGHQAGQNSTNSSQNTYIGMVSGKENIDGDCNTFVGSFTGQLNNGNSNTIIGNSAGSSGIGTASNNTFLGYLAGNNATNGSENTFLGDRASYGITTGNYNTSVGYRAGYQNQVGDGNVMLGYEAGFDETGSNNLYIANTNTTTPLIKGTFPNTDLTFTTSRVSIIHPTGTANGLYFQNTYLGNTDTWHFYQYTTDELALFFNTTKKGDFDNVSGAYTSVSDKRLKKNIEDYKNILDKVMLLKPKEYNFISQSDKDKKYIGLIAQEVKELFPSFVHHSEEDDTYTMDYAGLSVIAIQAIKEQQISIEENKKLETRIEHLELEIEEIKKLLK
ncbi:MAG: tail fiber domain-containing protein, partial [Candidatus Delongbacteria bacterium]|nr:tail fiber domain-containing protein [Candidatus Delongbacteria bacterium]